MAKRFTNPIHYRSSVDKKYEFTIPLSLTVIELKDKIAAESEIPADRQRLIYSGRVLKDPDTLETYKIKSGHTIHLVKSAGAKQSTPAASSPAGGSSTAATTGSGSAPSATNSVPSNIASGQGSFNPLAGLTGARYAGLAQLPSESLFGPDGGMGALPNEDDLERMMENPMFQSSMNEMLRNPQMLDYLIEQNPQLRAMGPQVRQMMQSDQFRQMISNPQMMRQMREMQRMFGGGAGGFGQPQQGQQSFPAPGANPTTDSTSTETERNTDGASTNTTGDAAAAANPFAALFPGGAPPANPFSLFGNPAAGAGGNGSTPAFDPALLQSILGGGGFGGAGATPQQEDNRPPEERYESQLRQLNDMGFSDFDRNVRALRRSGGSVQGAVENLLSEF